MFTEKNKTGCSLFHFERFGKSIRMTSCASVEMHSAARAKLKELRQLVTHSHVASEPFVFDDE